MTVSTKYPLKLGDVLLPAGEVGRTASLEEARTVFPRIGLNPASQQVAVVFRGMGPCIVAKKQLNFSR